MDEVQVGGTLIWYYYICKRQVWLISHQLTPDSDNPDIAVGKALHETAYDRDKKEVDLGHAKFDILRPSDSEVIVCEVKKSSKHLASATMQLAFYLRELKDLGVAARGEIRIPLERKTVSVELNRDMEEKLEKAIREIKEIVVSDPPAPVETKWCKKCGYVEFCWC